jgi:hypothetical protein
MPFFGTSPWKEWKLKKLRKKQQEQTEKEFKEKWAQIYAERELFYKTKDEFFSKGKLFPNE